MLRPGRVLSILAPPRRPENCRDKEYGADAGTDRRLAEEALRDSEAKLRVLLNASSDPILLMDAKGTILDINDSMAHELGKTVEKTMGHGIPTQTSAGTCLLLSCT